MTTLSWYFRAHAGPGEQLETVHLQRQRAQAAYDLIDYYTQFSRDDTTRIDNLKKEGKDGRHQVAILLRRLATLAKEVDLPTADKVDGTTLGRGPLIDASDRQEKISTGIVRSSKKTCSTSSTSAIERANPK
jgi:hypothetical protein